VSGARNRIRKPCLFVKLATTSVPGPAASASVADGGCAEGSAKAAESTGGEGSSDAAGAGCRTSDWLVSDMATVAAGAAGVTSDETGAAGATTGEALASTG